MQLTGQGIWLPTPFDVIQSSLNILTEMFATSESDRPLNILDAGMGDGRWIGALSIWSKTYRPPTAPPIQVHGIECDTELYRRGAANLNALSEINDGNRSWRTCCGDFLELSTYRELGIAPRELDLVLNYPDGNELELGSFLKSHARPGCRLLLVTPDRAAGTEALLFEATLAVPRRLKAQTPDWCLHLYRVAD